MITGSIVALVTPMHADGQIDWDAVDRLVEFHVKKGTDAIVAVGTTGESATLDAKDHCAFIEYVVKRTAGRRPVIAGTGGNSTAEAIEWTQEAKAVGADACLLVTPYYNKPPQRGLIKHYEAIAAAVDLPQIIYNVPGRTASNVLPSTVIRLANDFESIVAIKEAAGDIVQAMELISGCPKDFLVISGDDMITLPMVLAGGAGVISVIGEGFPKEFSKMVRLGFERKVDEAYDIHYKIAPAIDYIFQEGNPAGIKAVFKKLGICNDTVRLPLVGVSDCLRRNIDAFIEEF